MPGQSGRYWIDIPSDVKEALGQMIVQWAHLDATMDSHVRILLGQPGALTIPDYPDHLRVPANTRERYYRNLAAALYSGENAARCGQVLSKIANARGHREKLVHGTITPQEDGRLLVCFVQEGLDGKLKGANYWYTAKRIQIVAGQIASADYELSDSFSAHFREKHST